MKFSLPAHSDAPDQPAFGHQMFNAVSTGVRGHLGSSFKLVGYKRPTNTEGMVKLATAFGPLFAPSHEWTRKADTVMIADGERESRAVNRCYILGVWPAARGAVTKLRREIVGVPASSSV